MFFTTRRTLFTPCKALFSLRRAIIQYVKKESMVRVHMIMLFITADQFYLLSLKSTSCTIFDCRNLLMVISCRNALIKTAFIKFISHTRSNNSVLRTNNKYWSCFTSKFFFNSPRFSILKIILQFIRHVWINVLSVHYSQSLKYL